MSIDQWPVGERPRERLLAHGAARLSDAELLAVLLRSGRRGLSAIDLGRELLDRYGGVSGIFRASQSEMTGIAGLGPAKYAQLHAAIELARRFLAERMRSRDALQSPDDLHRWLRLTLAHRAYEVFLAVYLDAQNHVITTDELFRGTVAQTSVFPREVVRAALQYNASAVVACHNHPSGVAEPSVADQFLTDSIRRALATVEIRLIDHVIVAGDRIYSFAAAGLL